MADTFHLKVVTPRGAALEEDITSLTITTEAGEITALPGHCLLLSSLKAGRMIVFHGAGGSVNYVTAAGYLELGPDRANVICDQYVKVEDLETATVQQKVAELEKQLLDLPSDSPQIGVLKEELSWQKACLLSAEK
jgi:F-type H+-transporting ATPase subunit epsilon